MKEGSISSEAVTLCGQGRGGGMLLRVVECPVLLGRFDISGLDSASCHPAQAYCKGAKKYGGAYGDHCMKPIKDITRLLPPCFAARNLITFV